MSYMAYEQTASFFRLNATSSAFTVWVELQAHGAAAFCRMPRR